jgi:hypothetical protein
VSRRKKPGVAWRRIAVEVDYYPGCRLTPNDLHACN